MKIIIIGSGKVGVGLAERLTQEDHELVLVDRDPEALETAENTLDIMGMEGDGTNAWYETFVFPTQAAAIAYVAPLTGSVD